MKSFREKFKFVLFDNMRISDNERKIATFKFYSSLAKLDFLCYHSLCNNDTHKSRNGLDYYEKLRYKLCISLHLICALKTIHKTIIFLQLLFHDILRVTLHKRHGHEKKTYSKGHVAGAGWAMKVGISSPGINTDTPLA